jgi:hypothetical protein
LPTGSRADSTLKSLGNARRAAKSSEGRWYRRGLYRIFRGRSRQLRVRLDGHERVNGPIQANPFSHYALVYALMGPVDKYSDRPFVTEWLPPSHIRGRRKAQALLLENRAFLAPFEPIRDEMFLHSRRAMPEDRDGRGNRRVRSFPRIASLGHSRCRTLSTGRFRPKPFGLSRARGGDRRRRRFMTIGGSSTIAKALG